MAHTAVRYFVARAFNAMVWSDYIPTALKTSVFGLLIGAVSSFLGQNASHGALEASAALPLAVWRCLRWR